MNGGSLDIHKLLSKLLFSTIHIKNYICLDLIFLDHLTNLFYESPQRPGRLNDDLTSKPWSIPINQLDWAAYHHDLKYYSAEHNGKNR